MARYTGPKNRIARRFGMNVFGKLRNPLLHKPNPAGMHGAKRKKKSDFGLQLYEQQKLRAMYGMIAKRQLVKYYQDALRTKTATPQAFMQNLECRLDNIVYRLKLAPTIFAAHQLVSHGHIQVDGKKVDRRSFKVKPGMTVSVRSKSQGIAIVKQAIESPREVPGYLSQDAAKFSGQLLILPEADQIPLVLPVNVPLICEFLAHTN
jgi:small subunit ribosomal protein S4